MRHCASECISIYEYNKLVSINASVFIHRSAHCIRTSSSNDLSYDIHYLQSYMECFICPSVRSWWQIIFKFAEIFSSLVWDLDNQLYIISSSSKDLLHYTSISNLFSIQLESESELSIKWLIVIHWHQYKANEAPGWCVVQPCNMYGCII